ncbi:uncharacterized protein LOC113505764 [Trichoplusia ni]|uniref:Uncharacterized protein LOC113505764 n=1 Tax=Trichoplusia ni TaxID=7111 RepID=A0A7E5WW34_TRINI|nr:uncharacterized protein LOC113505764 [Trichoplusia ni]
MMITHECEQILYFILLRNVYFRLRIIKAHVLKVFCVENRTYNRGKLYKVEALSNNARLDISSLHKVYDLLHKCANELNSIMSLPLLIIVLSAGLSTTMLLKMVVQVIQTVTVSNAVSPNITIFSNRIYKKFILLLYIPFFAN